MPVGGLPADRKVRCRSPFAQVEGDLCHTDDHENPGERRSPTAEAMQRLGARRTVGAGIRRPVGGRPAVVSAKPEHIGI